MYKSTTKCNETICKWCKNKHGASKIIDTFETYHPFDPTGPLGLVKLDRLGSGLAARVWVGQSTQPSPLTLTLSSSSSLVNPKSPPPSPSHSAISGGLRRQCLGQNRRPSSLYHLLQLESAETSPPRRSGVVSPR
jgi:hypothetical protein